MTTDPDTTKILAPGPLLPPVPIVLQRQASDVSFMSPEVLREKLKAAGYREPVLPVPQPCIINGCANMTHTGVCFDCETEIAAGAFDHKPSLFWPIIAAIVVGCGIGLAVAFGAGWLS